MSTPSAAKDDREQTAQQLVEDAQNIVVFTGAGMSAESGVPTFRDALTGIWSKVDPAALATPEAWHDDPGYVWSWYTSRVAACRAVRPNAGHEAVAELARRKAEAGGSVQVITQNVDDLHERAGSEPVIHLHGSLFAPRCDACGTAAPIKTAENSDVQHCTEAGCPGNYRPGVVWFGEMLPTAAWADAEAAFASADLVIVVGTSGVVHPAASLPEDAAGRGVVVLEVNPDPSELRGVALRLPSTAAEGLPRLLKPR